MINIIQSSSAYSHIHIYPIINYALPSNEMTLVMHAQTFYKLLIVKLTLLIYSQAIYISKKLFASPCDHIPS